MNQRIFDSIDELVRAAARTIVQQVEGGARTIALSGGSTPKPLYELLGKSPLWEELAAFPITWVVVDERYVPESDPRSNAAMIEQTLFAQGMSEGHRFLPFRSDYAPASRCAEEFEREWKELGIGKLDVVILGIGDDGHTASLFPGSSALEVTDCIAIDVFVPKVEMWRVTITLPVIREAGLRLVLVAGASKQPAVEQARAGAELPIVRATAGVETWWLLDRAAAGAG
jgi:6-phosphogluconolactonase